MRAKEGMALLRAGAGPASAAARPAPEVGGEHTPGPGWRRPVLNAIMCTALSTRVALGFVFPTLEIGPAHLDAEFSIL